MKWYIVQPGACDFVLEFLHDVSLTTAVEMEGMYLYVMFSLVLLHVVLGS